MDYKVIQNAVNRIPQGATVFAKGELVQYIAMLIKGKVIIRNNGSQIAMGPGSFLGINDLYTGRYQNSYEALDDVALYMYPVSKVEDLEAVMSANNECNGYIVGTLYKLIYEFNHLCTDLLKQAAALHQFIKSSYQQCAGLADHKMNFQNFYERINTLTATDSDMELLSDRINYYSECRNLPINIVKQFYSFSNTVALYEIETQVNIINQQIEALDNLADTFVSMWECVMDDSDACLFHVLKTLAEDDKLLSEKNNYLLNMMDNLKNVIKLAEDYSLQKLNRELSSDQKRLEKLQQRLMSGNKKTTGTNSSTKTYTEEEAKQALEELKDSFNKILSYASIPEDKAESMKETMKEYIMLKDKLSNDDSARLIRRRLTENHYILYKEVFIKANMDVRVPRMVELFLEYGYADERLLTEEHLLYLYFLPEDEAEELPYTIYNIRSWLTAIYEGKKEPSKNEFDLDYTENLADMKRQGKLTEYDYNLWMTDSEKRLEYEINNMFRYNNRIANGQISTFVPVLHSDMLVTDVNRIRVTKEKIRVAMDKLINVDYSVFDREIIYTNSDLNIKREYIIKKIYPDIILLPTAGVNGVMWQEIAGKRRDTPARFILPCFTEVDLDNMLVKILGRFRWEICRTIEGALWNNITNKSLTSEYTYYLQFYRKNRDLSEERKEKIKSQLQKARNIREVFIDDYLNWVLYEATGAIKLNKPAREILATYCPFSKSIRERLRQQPLFEEAMNRYYHDKKKKIRELESRYRFLEKENIEVTEELQEVLTYYKES